VNPKIFSFFLFLQEEASGRHHFFCILDINWIFKRGLQIWQFNWM